jgi:RNA polymerase sigma-70 factor (ECF subfamily)
MQDHDPAVLATFDRYRNLLFSVAYRMLGSVADAEDILQEAFIRWQQATTGEIESPRAFLVTIVSRLCINHMQSARVRREKYVGEWLPEPLVTGKAGDPAAALKLDESLSMAFLVLLERLTPVERAVFLLREVFEYEYPEIAAALDQTEANCRQILHRARQHIAEMRPRFQASREERDELLQKFLQASSKDDVKGLLALLSSDVVLHSDGGGKAPDVGRQVHGAYSVAHAILESMRNRIPKERVARGVRVNGEPGIVTYVNQRPFAVLTVDTADGRIRGIYIVTNPEKLAHLPDLPSAAG